MNRYLTYRPQIPQIPADSLRADPCDPRGPRRFPCGDPDGFETEYWYDQFGRLTHRHHPDAGDDWYMYDPSGNLTRHTNAAGEHLDYTYHYNQLTDIACSAYPESNVHYDYGTAADASINAVGKVILQEDASGWQTFSYGKLGEVTENIRTFAPPFENQTYTFSMYFEYDSWNRIKSMTYPDGEVVTYDYNLGGMLDRVTGDKGSEHNVYVHHIEYNPFEQKETVVYGNGAVTSYSYDVLLRLSNLYSVCADGVMQDIDYTYDEVSNIGDIVNHAGMLTSGLGGTYSGQFTYDNLYRLAYADGNWHGNNTLYYETSMEYEKNGRISRKVLYADTWLDGNYTTENYDNEYYYVNSGQPNTLSTINEDQQSFEWDLKGNMVFHYNGHSGYNRSLCWDEQNRLLGVKDDEQRLSYYLYDANGDRTYKFTGDYTAQNQSGQWYHFYQLDKGTLYASPYLVSNEKGYTKHYYAETERIASRIGGGGLQDLHKGFETYPDMVSSHKESSANLFGKVMDCLDADALPQEDALKYLYEWLEFVEEEKDCYWYHPDHLGSSSWITYTDGSAVQHLHYLPWGEDFVDQRSSNWNAMYTFSAKEKDTETGYSYFGSRYYNSDLSIWLSVDPMSDKYPSLSPYVYCADNPVKLVDPNGEDWFENELTGDVYYNRDYRKGDEKSLEGKGWKWMGGNNMFEKSDDDVINSNLDKVSGVSCRQDGVNGIGSASFEGENAEAFMNNMGYKRVPSQVVTYDNTYSYSISDGKHSFQFTLGGKYDYTETSTYVPNNYSESHRRQIGNSIFGNKDPMSGQMPQVSRYAISYSKSPDFSGVGRFFYALAGQHDYTDHFNCGRLSSAKLSGTQGSLIRKFLSQN